MFRLKFRNSKSEPQEPSEKPPPDMVFSLIHQYFKPVKVNKCSNCSEAEIASKNNEKSLFKAAKCFMHHENCNWCVFLTSLFSSIKQTNITQCTMVTAC